MLQSIFSYSIIIVVMLFFSTMLAKKNSIHNNSKNLTLKKNNFWRVELMILIFLFTIFFGIRYNVGRDYMNYLIPYLDGSYYNTKFEPLFFFITDICYGFDVHPTIYFSIFCFIQITFFIYAFKDDCYIYPLLILFLFLNGDWLSWMNIIRQSLAMCIWLYSITFIVEKKFWHYIIWGIIAFLFHRSALILFVFYPLLRNGKDYFKSIPLQLILFASVFIIRNVFEVFILQLEPIIEQFQTILGGKEDLYRSYTMDNMLDELNNEVSGTGLAYMFRILVWIIIILYSRKLKSYYNSKKFNIIYFFFFFGLLTQYIFPEGVIFFSRPFRYFYIFQTIMLAYFIYYLLKSNSFRFNKILADFLIIAFIGIFVLSLITAPVDNYVWYQTYFQNIR